MRMDILIGITLIHFLINILLILLIYVLGTVLWVLLSRWK